MHILSLKKEVCRPSNILSRKANAHDARDD
jgi:hypothetical protein